MASAVVHARARAVSRDRRSQADLRSIGPSAPCSPLLAHRHIPADASLRIWPGSTAVQAQKAAAKPAGSVQIRNTANARPRADACRTMLESTPGVVPACRSSASCAAPGSPLVASRVVRASVAAPSVASSVKQAFQASPQSQARGRALASESKQHSKQPTLGTPLIAARSPPKYGDSEAIASAIRSAVRGDDHLSPSLAQSAVVATPLQRGVRAGSPVLPARRLRGSVVEVRDVDRLPVAHISPSISGRPLRNAKASAAAASAAVLDEMQVNMDMEPWLRAAQKFKMNDDFALPGLGAAPALNLKNFMDIMKTESEGKPTIQALADKIMLSQICDNLQIPHLPNLLAVWDGVTREDVADLIDREILNNPEPEDIVMKPTHLSSGAGVCSITTLQPDERDEVVDWLTQHMQEFMAMQAAAHESLALQSLRPGFVAQPCYKAAVRFKLPLELRVVALWGKVRMGIWWWGRPSTSSESPHRNVWIVRHPVKKDELSDQDEWKVIHNHTGVNLGFEKAIEIFERHMQTMVAYCETLATAVGAPFLRADFFVGSSKWGVRLNEVAYGCGCDYRNRALQHEVSQSIDDGPAMARILQEGMHLCQAQLPAREFLARLGMRGREYNDMEVRPLRVPLTPRRQVPRVADNDEVLTEEQCETPKSTTPARQRKPSVARRSQSPPANQSSAPRSRSADAHVDVRSLSRGAAEASRGQKQSSPRSNALNRRSIDVNVAAQRSSSSDVGRAPPKLHKSIQSRSPQRSLVAQAITGASKARELSLHHGGSMRAFVNVARFGGA